jgi:hypothetical protein
MGEKERKLSSDITADAGEGRGRGKNDDTKYRTMSKQLKSIVCSVTLMKKHKRHA